MNSQNSIIGLPSPESRLWWPPPPPPPLLPPPVCQPPPLPLLPPLTDALLRSPFLSLRSSRSLSFSPAKGLGFRQDNAVAVKAQLNDDVGGSANNSASSGTKADSSSLKGKNVRNENVSPPSAPLTEEAIAEFMTQVASLVELVDSRDIVELQLKQNDCEVIIRKKEALPQPPPSQVVMMQTPLRL